MKMQKFSKPIQIIIATAMLAILFPLIIYLFNFSSRSFSDDTADWTIFADFVGGTVNTLISLISLLTLGYLTYYVSKNTNQQNKIVNVLIRRIDAYEVLASYYPEIEKNGTALQELVIRIVLKTDPLNPKFSKKDKKESIKELEELQRFYKTLFHFIESYGLRYGHLYSYDFISKDFIELVLDAYNMDDYVFVLKKKVFEDLPVNSTTDYTEKNKSMKEGFKKLLIKLKQELI